MTLFESIQSWAFPVTSVFNGVTNVINGYKQRKQQNSHFNASQELSREQFKSSEKLTRELHDERIKSEKDALNRNCETIIAAAKINRDAILQAAII